MAAGISLRPGEGRFGTQFFLDCLDHTLGIQENIVVPEAQHAPSVFLEPGCTRLIVRTLSMLAAIELNDELVRDADEIGNEWADGLLAAKFVAREISVP